MLKKNNIWKISFVLFVSTLLVRLTMLEVHNIPGKSMENTIISGDKIVVNKVNFGAKLPQSPFEIPVVSLLFQLNKKHSNNIDSIWWKPHRLPGIRRIKRGEILVFNNPAVFPGNYVKRCVGLSGDMLSLIDGMIYINGENDAINQIQTIKNDFPQSPINQNKDSIKWLMYNCHPIQIPYKGFSIILNDSTCRLYEKTITTWEEQELTTKDSRFYLNGENVSTYTFKKDYYFLMGDNRNHSYDSRMWGFLPEEQIVGIATRVLWSYFDGKLKWNRTYKKLK